MLARGLQKVRLILQPSTMDICPGSCTVRDIQHVSIEMCFPVDRDPSKHMFDWSKLHNSQTKTVLKSESMSRNEALVLCSVSGNCHTWQMSVIMHAGIPNVDVMALVHMKHELPLHDQNIPRS